MLSTESHKKFYVRLILCTFLYSLIIVYKVSNFTMSISNSNRISRSAYKPIILLIWTEFTIYSSFEEVLSIIYAGQQRDPDCCADVQITGDRKFLDNATAILIHTYTLGIKDLPPRRTPEQLWIFLAPESPVHTPKFTHLKNLLNWTMTYRRDSDVYSPYGEIVRKVKLVYWENLEMENGVPLDKWISNKKKLFGAAITNCHPPSKRERLLKALKNISFPVDVYGRCGKRICGRWNHSCDETHFWTEFARDYKFYYAAENSLCTEYITEKFWRSLQLGVVPVVYGGANYTEVAPPHSFIDVKNFSSPERLTEYLRKLDENPKLYKEYFRWRTEYDAKVYDENLLSATCKLCRKLVFKRSLKNSKAEMSKYVMDVDHWWRHMPNGEGEACSKAFF